MNSTSVNRNGKVKHSRLRKTPSGQTETQIYRDEAACQPALVLAQVHEERNHVSK